MRGRKPKPLELKKILGNPGKRPLNTSAPQPNGIPAKPKFVRGRAATIWNTYAPKLIAVRVLTAVDGMMFGVWCCLAAEFEKNPNAMTAARISQMRALASSFGLDPSSRTRLTGSAADPTTDDPAEKYFAELAARRAGAL